MKASAVIPLAAAGLTAVMASIGWFMASNLDLALARYPGSQFPGEEDVGSFSLHGGHIAEVATFRTQDGWADVLRWYHDELGLEPQKSNGVNVRAMCWTLGQASQQFFVRRVTTVTLCAKRVGTLVYVRRTISFVGFSQAAARWLPRPAPRANAANRNRP
jgi:hypothetical protein